MKTMTAARVTYAHNIGIAAQFALAATLGVPQTKHDSVPYDKGSDISAQGMEISVKASGFTLMSGNLCEGRESFDSIWELYAERVHSDTFAYVTADFTVYMMTLAEFKRFVYAFCRVERESEKNGGAMKIRCRKESAKMLRWLAEAAA